jgi:hypothetical protein
LLKSFSGMDLGVDISYRSHNRLSYWKSFTSMIYPSFLESWCNLSLKLLLGTLCIIEDKSQNVPVSYRILYSYVCIPGIFL